MPVDLVRETLQGEQFSLVAMYGADGRGVCHVALLADACDVGPNAVVRVYHASPPIEAGQPDEAGDPIVGQVQANILARFELTPAQRKAVERNLAYIRTRVPHRRPKSSLEKLASYVALPPENDDGPHLRVSCSGFILRALRWIFPFEIVDTGGLPEVDLILLRRIWDPHWVESPALRVRIGLGGSGPWRVLLPGYLVHAHTPDAPVAAYVAQPGDEDYPVILGRPQLPGPPARGDLQS